MLNIRTYLEEKLEKAFKSEKLLEYTVRYENNDLNQLSGLFKVKTKTEKNKVLTETEFSNLDTMLKVDDWLAEILSIMLMNHHRWYK